MTDTAPSAKPLAAAIYALTIERFRGITSLKWKPSRGVNVILGGGDVGKTTILEAIALLLSPVNPTTLSDPDYHDRDIEAGFSVEAVLSLPAGAGMSIQMKPSWPWEWTGEEAAVPALEHDAKLTGEPVYRVRVRGTEDLELAYEIVQPDGSADSFPVALRRAIGLVRLSGDDRNDRDLRLVQGSALDRLLSDRLGNFEDIDAGLAEITHRRTYGRPKPPDAAISTIHKAKGLECGNVVVMPCDATTFPDREDARCLLYVALSRAKERLMLVVSRANPSPLFCL